MNPQMDMHLKWLWRENHPEAKKYLLNKYQGNVDRNIRDIYLIVNVSNIGCWKYKWNKKVDMRDHNPTHGKKSIKNGGHFLKSFSVSYFIPNTIQAGNLVPFIFGWISIKKF